MGKVSEVLRAVTGIGKHRFAAVILAAGSGTRMGGTPKQYRLVAGVPVLARSMLAFENCPDCAEIVVVCRAGDEELCRAMAAEYTITKFKTATAGGETRGASSLRGFAAVSEKIDYVAFHDAARCLVDPALIAKVFHEAECAATCAIAAMPVCDTLKTVNALGRVTSTPDRSAYVAAATPQIYRSDVFRAVAYTAERNHFTGTDDASLAEHYGFEVRTVVGDKTNIKITFPEDVAVAEALLALREKTEGAE